MKCPNCGNQGPHPVSYIKKQMHPSINVRRRICSTCKQLFTTSETYCPKPRTISLKTAEARTR